MNTRTLKTVRRWGDLNVNGLAILPLLAVLFALYGMFALHRPFLSPATAVHVYDEGYINAFSMRMLDGQMLPYVDAVSNRGPMLYWVAATAYALGPPMTWVSMRVLALVLCLGTIILTYLLATTARKPLVGAVGALGVLFLQGCYIGDWADGLGYGGEMLINVFGLSAVIVASYALAAHRAAPHLPGLFAAGILSALALMSKHFGVVIVIALLPWIVAASRSRPASHPWLPVVCFLAGWLSIVLIVVLRYAAAGELQTFVYYFSTYNKDVYMAPYADAPVLRLWAKPFLEHPAITLLAGALALFGLVKVLPERRLSWKALDDRGWLLTVTLMAIGAGLVANTTLRDFKHYYVQVIPWFALLAGFFIYEVLERFRVAGFWRRTLEFAPLFLLILFCNFSLEARLKGIVPPSRPLVCDDIARVTDASDKIFVWGFRPDLHTFCQRRPASRFVMSEVPAGFVPWDVEASPAEDRARVAPGSQQLLMADLSESRPRLIVEAAGSLGGRGLSGVAGMDAYLATEFCPPVNARPGLRFFLRKAPEGCSY